MAWSKRKPYYNLKQSNKEFFSASARYLKDSLTKESYLEKPYRQTDRGAMHQDWPSFVFPPFGKYPDLPWWQPWRPPFAGLLDFGFPRLTFPDLKWPAQDPTDPESISSGPIRRYGERPDEGLSTSPDSPSDTQGGLWIQPTCKASMDTSCLDVGESALILVASNNKGLAVTWGVEIDYPEVLSHTIIPIENDRAFIKLTALKKQERQSVHVEVWASWVRGGKIYTNRCATFNITVPCDCDQTTGITWDDSGSIETLARNNNGTVAITGGIAPYVWTVSGTGFTLTNAETLGLSNTLSADGTACGSADITVTDGCGSTATGYVREPTNGQWVASGNGEGLEACKVSGAQQGTIGAFYYRVGGGATGKYRQQQEPSGAGGGGCVPAGDCATECADRDASQGTHPT